jgi:Ni/Fe-hydrogenase subunit HybB-like protein
MVLVLGMYFIVRIQDIASRGALPYIFDMSYQSMMFLIEISIGVVIPFFLLIWDKVRKSKIMLFYSSLMVVLGFIAHRINCATTAFEINGKSYTPSWQEFAVTAGLVAFGFMAFTLIAKYFNIFESNGQSHANN